MRENVHQMRLARAHRKRNGGPLEAALSAVQVGERADLTPAQVVERLTEGAADYRSCSVGRIRISLMATVRGRVTM